MHKPVGRPSEGKVRTNLTLSPEFIKAARKADPNLSRFVEAAGWERLKSSPKWDRKPKTEGKP